MGGVFTGSTLGKSMARLDKYGLEIKPGNVCVYSNNTGLSLCVYARDAKYGHTGRYGRFYTTDGIKTLLYGNVVVAYDPINTTRRIIHEDVKKLIKEYYG